MKDEQFWYCKQKETPLYLCKKESIQQHENVSQFEPLFHIKSRHLQPLTNSYTDPKNMDLYLIKTTQFYLNYLKLKSLTTRLNSRTVFNLQNRHLHPSAPSNCNVVKNNRTPVLIVGSPNVHGRFLRKWFCMCYQNSLEPLMLNPLHVI